MCDYDSDTADQSRAAERRRQARIRQGEAKINTVFDRYNDVFYEGRARDYANYAKPQLDRDYDKGMLALKAALARQGLSKSSISQDRDRMAQTSFGEELQNMRQRGEGYKNQARDSVESARSNLLSQNLALADPTAAAQAARARVHSLSALPQYQPMVDTFAHLAEGLATQADLERRRKARYDLFGLSPQSRVRVVDNQRKGG